MEILCTLFDGKLCDKMLERTMDMDPSVDNHSRYRTAFSNFPSGASWKSYIHYLQQKPEEESEPYFRRYNYYKEEENILHYN